MKIFISFSNKDNYILQSFVDHYLKLGLNIKNKEISCTGIEDSKPKSGEDFRNWIKNEIEHADIIFILISRNYKNSEVCLNELGATWMLNENKKVIPLLLPPVDYSNVGFLHNSNQLLKIDSKNDLFILRDDIKEWIKDRNVSTSNLNSQINKLVKEIGTFPIFSELNVSKEKVISKEDFSYFDKFLVDNIDYRGLLLQAQPTLSDCKVIFNQDFFKDVYDYYNYEFKSLLQFQEPINDLSEYDTYEIFSASYDDLRNNNHELPGGMTELTKNDAIKANTRFYTLKFKRKLNDFGTTFTAWVLINNRWILFVKPWIVVEFISAVRYDKSINRWIKILKKIGILKKYDSFELKYIMNRIIE